MRSELMNPKRNSRPPTRHGVASLHRPRRPDAATLAALAAEHGIPSTFVQHTLDADELARVERDGDALLIVFRIPHVQKANIAAPYTTVPLGLIVSPKTLLTVCTVESAFLSGMPQTVGGQTAEQQLGYFVLHLLQRAADSCSRSRPRSGSRSWWQSCFGASAGCRIASATEQVRVTTPSPASPTSAFRAIDREVRYAQQER